MPGDAVPAFVFVPQLPAAGERGAFTGEERHHVLTVCRGRPGDTVTGTDGDGARATLRLLAAGREATFEVLEVTRSSREGRAVIGCGAPEGARADWLVEKLAELGIDVLQPIDCERGAWRWSAARAARLERVALAALKQSRQVYRLRIAPPARLGAWIDSMAPGGTRWLADAGGQEAGERVDRGSLLGACGPAAGLTGAEKAGLQQAGFLPVRLAGGVLRSETAGVALAALWASAQVR